jgi:hypothetical protein
MFCVTLLSFVIHTYGYVLCHLTLIRHLHLWSCFVSPALQAFATSRPADATHVCKLNVIALFVFCTQNYFGTVAYLGRWGEGA